MTASPKCVPFRARGAFSAEPLALAKDGRSSVNELVAVIPARGGSQRIPRKNIIDFEGRPMIAWTIAAARASRCFARVLVSTDDPEIARVAEDHGAEVPFLRIRHADHHSPVSQATIETLMGVGAEAEMPSHVAQLFAVCPLRTADDIREATAAFRSAHAPLQLSCYRWPWGHPFWSFTRDERGAPHPLFPDQRLARSQDLPMAFLPTGAIWIADTAALLQAGTFYGPGHVFHELPWQRAIDIDTVADLELARLIHRSGRATP